MEKMYEVPQWLKDYDKYFKAEMAKSNALGKGVKVGKIFSLPVADNYAYYKIVKVNKKTVKVEWMEKMSPDGYQYFLLGEGGTIQLSKIECLM